MKKLILTTLLLIAAPIFIFSQIYNKNSNMSDFINQRNFGKFTGYDDKNSPIVGSPYDNDEFQLGYIISKTNQKYNDIKLRFNIYNNSIEYKNEEGEIYSLSIPELFDFFTIGEKKYKYYPYSVNKKVDKGYFSVISEGKATLLLKERVIFKEATEPAAYKEAEPAKFNRVIGEYYIQIGEHEARRIGGKKDLIEILSADVEGFIKKNKINQNKKEDLTKLIEYYNSL